MSLLKKIFFLSLILLSSGILFFINYKSETYLIGWDNLFPEFNFKENITRTLFSSWQHYRGLGALDNFSHAANLIHDLYRFFISLFFPISFVRWFFVFSLYFLGGLGQYLLLKKIIKNKFISILSALFYLLNFYIIQQFFLPFEPFVIHFSALPWLFLSLLNFLQKKEKKD
ncbi:MAG: hypothetical protein KatS3mg090_0849 [Patescibacteria group bacterium]|nr:MAG: hypothetical protein KatS3mg090_0849 [Patescibacteria group bacterium]